MKIDTLSQLRIEIDKIDDQIITLLKNRMEIVKRVGKVKKETSVSQSFIRAGREASMLRNLIKKADGAFPPAAVATIWRMIISTSLSIEQEIPIYTYSGSDKNCFWLAREYFGTFLEIYTEENVENLITKVSGDPAAVGVLPLMDNSKNPWWVRPKGEANNIYVFARIPFVEDNKLVQPVLAIANTMPEPTDEDISLFCVTTNIDEKTLREVFKKNGLVANIISCSGNKHFLIEVSQFVPVGNEIVKNIEHALEKGDIVRLMGSYAVQLKI